MDNITMQAAQRVAKARAELILARTFYGVLVSQVDPQPSRAFPTMATNGKVHYFNPEFITGLTANEVLGVQAHETEHDARRHHSRRNGRDPKEWNIATDLAINPDLIREGFTLPKGALLDWKYEGWSAEDIYRARELDRKQQPQKPEEGDGQADDEEQEDGGDHAPDDVRDHGTRPAGWWSPVG